LSASCLLDCSTVIWLLVHPNSGECTLMLAKLIILAVTTIDRSLVRNEQSEIGGSMYKLWGQLTPQLFCKTT
jgi:hypothetical protein